MSRISLATLIALAAFGTVTTGGSQSQTYYHWYHPAGSACPYYPYDPSVEGASEKAKAQCEKETGKTCSQAQGTAEPAC